MSNPRYDENIERLVNAHSDITTAILQKGGTVTRSDGFENFASDIRTIPQEGGGGVVQSRNFVKVTATEPSTQYGITFTPDPFTGIIDINGSCTASNSGSIQFAICDNDWTVPVGTYKLYAYPVTDATTVSPADGLKCGYTVYSESGSSGSSATVSFSTAYTLIANDIPFTANDTGFVVTLTLPSNTAVTFNHAKVKVMLMDNADESTDYEPYTLNTLELTEYADKLNDESIKAIKLGTPVYEPNVDGIVELTLPTASTSSAGIVQLTDNTNVESSVIAASATAVRSAMSTASSAATTATMLFNTISGGSTKNIFPMTLYGIKNLNPDWEWNGYTAHKGTNGNNVYVTLNVDGTISVKSDNSSVGTQKFNLGQYTFLSKSSSPNDVELSGCPSGGSTSTYYLEATDNASFNRYETGSGENIYNLSSNITADINIVIKSGPYNLLFKPMICTWSAWQSSTEYAPYCVATDIKELNILNNEFDLRISDLVAGSKNILSYNNCRTTTLEHCKFDYNSNGSITVTDLGTTATANAAYNVAILDSSYYGKKVILTGCPENGDYSNSYALYAKIGDTTISDASIDTGSGATFTIPSNPTDIVYITILIRQNYTVSEPLTFRPMLRLADMFDDSEFASPAARDINLVKVVSQTFTSEQKSIARANIDAASADQGSRADSAVQTIKIGGSTQTKIDGTVNLPASLPASDTVSTYSSTGTAPVNGKAVKASMTGTLDSTDSNHSATSKAVADSQAEQDAEIAIIVNAGAKSLLPIGVSSITYANAVTFSVAYDGTITVNGTNPNSYAGIPYADLVTAKGSQLETRYTLPAGKYKITSTGDGLKFQVHCHDGTNAYPLFSSKSSGEFEYTSALKTQYPYICWRLAIDANASFSNQIVKPMIWNAEIKDSTFQPYALSNPVITPALVNQVDSGAKNKLHITQIGSSDANVGTKITSQGVEYEIQSDGTITAYRKTSSSSGAYIFLYENGSVKNVSEFFDGQHVWSGNPSQYPSTISIWYKVGSGSNVTMPNGTILPDVNGASVRIGFQINSSLSPSQSDPIVFKPMICSVSDWQVSQKFVPYCPTMQELYQMILALQNGGA